MELTNEEIQDRQINKVLGDNCGYGNVMEWLLGMGLGQYYDLFIENGYDCFRVCSEIQRIDIDTIGILNQAHVNILIKGVARINNSKAQSVYHRLSIASPDENEFKSLANELNISPSPLTEHSQTNGFHSPKLTENFYKKKPTLTEKRSIRTMLIQLNVDLTDHKYTDGSTPLDKLAEEISQHLNLEVLSVYDILCLMRSTALENSSTKPSKQPFTHCMSNGDVPTANTTEDVFQENSTPLSISLNLPKAHVRPRKPPRSGVTPEEKPSLYSLTNEDSIQPASTHSISTSSMVSVPELVYQAYDILHSDILEPQVMTEVKSPIKQANKPDSPPPTATSTTSAKNSTEEEQLYIQLDNTVQQPKPPSSSIFGGKKTKNNTKKSQEDLLKKPPNQPPPPPPANSTHEVDNSAGKSKTNKLIKQESNASTTEDTTNNSTTTTNENKSKKPTSFFKRSTKAKNDTKLRSKKSKDESDLISSLRGVEDAKNRKRMSKNLSKSSDNLFAFTTSQDCNEEQNNWKSTQPNNQENPLLTPSKTNLRKTSFVTHIPDLIPLTTDGDNPPQSIHSLPPNPTPRRRNSPEETVVTAVSHTLPRQNSESKGQVPKKPKRHISDDTVYDNVEKVMPNPVPRYKTDTKFDIPPQRSNTMSSRPMNTVSPDIKPILSRDISCNNIARVKPEIPKGKKPVLKAKPVDGTQAKRDRLIGEPQLRKDTNIENVITRISSPLTAPPLPTTKRPDTPLGSNQPPEPPPIHSIPSIRPIAHVRPTKPPITASPSSNSSPIAEPRNVDNWRKIEDKIWTILKEEDFLDYLITHYTKENGESGISPGLVCRLATETSLAIHHVASALDNIRITRLNELGRTAVPISLVQFDEMDTPAHVDNIPAWLTSIGLPNYIQVFQENVKDPKEIKNIDADDLSEFFISYKHRGCLLHAIDMLQ